MNSHQTKPQFKKETSDFFQTLRDAVLKSLGKDYQNKAQRKILIKGILLFSLFVTCIAFHVYFTNNVAVFLSLSIGLGVLCLPLVLNIGHEAVHHHFSKSKSINQLGKSIFYFLGTSAYFWELRHLSSHHAYVNVKGWDTDIEQSSIIRLHEEDEHHKHHRFQHYYMPFAFLLYTLIWFFVRDFKDLSKKSFGAKSMQAHPIKEVVLLILAKIWHLTFLVILPFMTSQNLTLVLSGFLLFHLTASLVTTFALISTHVGEHQEITTAAEDGILPYTWVEHQFKTTADFSTSNIVLSHFFGGFNHHVAHHLFPNIPHVLYHKVTPIIQKHCHKNGIEYMQYPNLITCAQSHFKRLKAHSFIVETF